MMQKLSKGFTLIEIAIVLVIIGLLLGGVIKGEELIRAARVRSLISEEQGIKAAFYGFQDRFRALPGDYAGASANINCAGVACVDGDGNGRIEAGNAGGMHEELMLWTHLTAAGFLTGSFSATAADSTPSDANNPKNPYSVYIQLAYDANYGNGTVPSRHNLKTGGHIPVELIAEIDRKIDDGNPYTGAFQFSTYAPAGGVAPNAATCVSGTSWNIAGDDSNCAGASLF
jgi:prepilin-type N-terminal cleavage/methylation domain-containing protein